MTDIVKVDYLDLSKSYSW